MSWLTGIDERGAPYTPAGQWAIYASHIGEYMRRWIFLCPWGMVRLHHILREDLDRDPHDHPFDFTSVILRGGYSEQRFTTAHVEVSPVRRPLPTVRYERGSVIRRRAEDLHILTSVDHGTWTLVFTSPKRKPWGFSTIDRGWMSWREYVNSRTRNVTFQVQDKPDHS